MRSVVVVLPASMCAMIPMLRVLARSAVAAMVPSRFVTCLCSRLPAVVREGLVGLGHLVGVLATLDAGAQAVAGVEDLVHEALGHRLLTPLPRVADEPAQRERGAARGLDLDRHLVGRATDAAALDLEGGLDVIEGALERDDGVGAGLVAGDLEGA